MAEATCKGGDLSVSSALRQLRKAFLNAGIESPDLNARLLVEHATGLSKNDLVLDRDRALDADETRRIENLTARRLAGEPPYRIIGEREFYGLVFRLNENTLEPRPDTETLVNAVLPRARQIGRTKGSCSILDLGTGSGAIGVALAANLPDAIVTGTDVSAEAVSQANENGKRAGVGDRFGAIAADWYSGINGRFDIIVSNPPYIGSQEISGLAPEVRDHDPVRALDGGTDGLDAYRSIAAGCTRFLNTGGIVVLEIGFGQRQAVIAIFEAKGLVSDGVEKDLSGVDRALLFRTSSVEGVD